MSYERGLQALHLQMPDRIAHTEYLSNWPYMRKLTGLDTDDPAQRGEAMKRVRQMLDLDIVFSTYGHPLDKGRSSWMGSAKWTETQQPEDDRRYGYESVEEVLTVDPIAEYGIHDPEEQAREFQRNHAEGQRDNPTLVLPGGVYNTVFTWCIKAFGWMMFMEAATADPERFDRVLEGFFQISLADCEAWAKTDIRVFICHDDIVWSAGPVFHPDWYREHIFPRYPKLWAPLKEKGIPILFCSDGDYTVFLDDLAEAGADGFIFEPYVDLAMAAENYGQSKALIGGMDVRTLMFDTDENIRAAVKRCCDIGRNCPGYFIAVGNHIPYNVPVDKVDVYMDAVREYSRR